MPVCSFTWRCIDVRLHYSSHHHHERLAACFPAEVVFVEQAHCHRPHHRSGRRVYVQSRRRSTLAGTCFVTPRHRTVVSSQCCSPLAWTRRRQWSRWQCFFFGLEAVLLTAWKTACLKFIPQRLGLHVNTVHWICGLGMGLAVSSMPGSEVVASVTLGSGRHASTRAHACAGTHSQTRTSTHAHAPHVQHAHARAYKLRLARTCMGARV